MDMRIGKLWLHRRIIDSSVFKNETKLKVWIWCLSRANHTTATFPWNGTDITLHPGQFITGRTVASQELDMSEQRYRTAMAYLKATERITIKSTNKFSIITVKNWAIYQSNNKNQPAKHPTNNHQSTTDKNDKNVKNETLAPSVGTLGNEIIDLFQEINPSYRELFKRRNQRDACERLLATHSFEMIKKAVEFAQAKRTDRFCPAITTPAELEDRWARLEKYAVGLRNGPDAGPKWKVWV